eukprot:m.432152 g.432152  ORF g.432152 m.432152 type:complete len:59 (-) comp17395_c0_seq1:3315-3491(-)
MPNEEVDTIQAPTPSLTMYSTTLTPSFHLLLAVQSHLRTELDSHTARPLNCPSSVIRP